MEWLPLLQIQRDLLSPPRNTERFRRYLDVMRGTDGELRLPLPAFNPMSKAHVAELLDALLGLGAERIGEASMQEASAELPNHTAPDSTQLGLVVADDAAGGWTNRWLFEARHHFENRYERSHGMLTALLWSSEPAEESTMRETVRATVYRDAWIAKHGPAQTLRAMLRQEGYAARFAGRHLESLPAALEARIEPHLETTHFPTLIACLYGADAALSCGYDPLGLPAQAGLRYGLTLAGGLPDALTQLR